MKTVTIGHLFPREMNIYGDMGNILSLRRRLEWRGFRVRVEAIEQGSKPIWDDLDIVFGGGGQDSGQLIMGEALGGMAGPLQELAQDQLPMLVICGSYQLFGRGFTTMEGQEIPGIGIFGASTVGGSVRMIGNVVIDTTKYGRLVGFENHSGQTMLEPGQAALGVVRKGFGNNPTSKREGAVQHEVIGTYLHGPVLPKNPALADALILAGLKRRWGITELEPLDDTIEQSAAHVAERRPQ